MRVLVLEASTSAAKALLYDTNRGAVAVECEPYPSAASAGGRYDAREICQAALRVGRKAAAGREVAAIGLGGVWHSIMACDRRLEPVTPAYLWNYPGASAIARSFRERPELARRIYSATGCMPNAIYPPYIILHMRQEGLDTRERLFVSQGGHLFHHLTGEWLESRCLASGMGLVNIGECRYDEEILGLCGARSEQFGALADSSDTRPLAREAADRMGIASGIPVVPAHADGCLNQIGSGALAAGRMTFSVGTSAAIRLSSERPILSDPPATWCYRGVGGWLAGAATNGAGNCVAWFRETFLRNRRDWDELESGLLEGGPTPVFLPFLFGERCPGWDDTRRGGFEELDGGNSAASLYRALCEGVLFNVYQCYRILTRHAGVPERIVLSGGILNSRGWTQMAADIFQREMMLSDSLHASLLGGAALALRAAGGLASAGDFETGDTETVSPRPEAAEQYERRFQRYLDCYARGK